MSIVSLQELLKDAKQKQYAVGMFDIHNLEMTNAVIQAAETQQSPVILALAEVHIHSLRQLKELTNIMVYAARNANVPVAVHYDHGTRFDYLMQVIFGGFSSVMYDGSLLPYEENCKNTGEIAAIAHALGVSVEGELGHVGGTEGGDGGHHDMIYTDPSLAADYVARTKVDALAVAIGNAHGRYHGKPELRIDVLQEIQKQVEIPLVLHGGSGLSDEQFQDCIRHGISKINIYTEMIQAVDAIRERDLQQSYTTWLEQSVQVISELVEAKMQLFGSSGRA